MQALAVHMVRRHARTAEDEHHYGPSVGVVSGNYVTGKRRGIVDGVDFGATGSGAGPKPRRLVTHRNKNSLQPACCASSLQQLQTLLEPRSCVFLVRPALLLSSKGSRNVLCLLSCLSTAEFRESFATLLVDKRIAGQQQTALKPHRSQCGKCILQKLFERSRDPVPDGGKLCEAQPCCLQ